MQYWKIERIVTAALEEIERRLPMANDLYERWLEWSRANPEPEIECCCECHREEREQGATLAALTPEMIAAATEAIFGRQ